MFTRLTTTEPRLPVWAAWIPYDFFVGEDVDQQERIRITTWTSATGPERGVVDRFYTVERRAPEPGLPWSVVLRYEHRLRIPALDKSILTEEEYLVGVTHDGLVCCLCKDFEESSGRQGEPCKHIAACCRLGLIPDPTKELPPLPEIPKHGHESTNGAGQASAANNTADARREARTAADRAERRGQQDRELEQYAAKPCPRERI